ATTRFDQHQLGGDSAGKVVVGEPPTLPSHNTSKGKALILDNTFIVSNNFIVQRVIIVSVSKWVLV
ncbi:MAG TPA: hypothetical protein PKH83_07125, partial [Cyclobacteriaceae bacterium]|nr:hypothetical protein [Cyclobacteriaceae bacterium]